MHDNQLGSLPAGIFDSNLKLIWLYAAAVLQRAETHKHTSVSHSQRACYCDRRLDNNRLATLPSGIFDKQTKLTDL